MRSSSIFRFYTSSFILLNNNNNNNNNISAATKQLSAKVTVDTLTKLLDGKHINAFCSVLRDGYHPNNNSSNNFSHEQDQQQQPQQQVLISPFPASSGLNSSRALIESSMPFTNQYQKQMRLILRRSVHDALEIDKENELNIMEREIEQMKSFSPNLFSEEEVNFMLMKGNRGESQQTGKPGCQTNNVDHLFETEKASSLYPTLLNNASSFRLAKELFNAKVSTFLSNAENPQDKNSRKMVTPTATTTRDNNSNNNTNFLRKSISPASWMVLANVAVSQGMWIRSLEIFDKLMLNNSLNLPKNIIDDADQDEVEEEKSNNNIFVNNSNDASPSTRSLFLQNRNENGHRQHHRRPPAPHTIAQTLRPGNIKIIRKWCRRNNAKLDIVTGMKVLVEYSDDWAAALRLALEEERQPQSAPRGACESYSLGVLIPFLANGGKWTTASAVLADALARGSLVSDSLVQMILKSTAQQRTWVSCLSLASALSSCFAISPSSSNMMSISSSTSNSIAPSNNSSSSNIQQQNNRELLVTLRAVAAVCRTWEQACSMISVCKRAGMKSGDEFIVGSAMEKLQRNGKWMEASQLIQIAVEDGTLTFAENDHHYDHHQNAPLPSASAPHAAAAAAGATTASSSEYSWMANLTKSNLEIMIAKRLIDSFRAECRWAGALKALSWMGKADSAAAAAGLIATIEMCANAGEWKAAAEIGARVLFSGSSSPNSNTTAMSKSSSSSSSSTTSQLASSHNQHHNRIVRSESLYLTLIQALSNAGRWREAAHTFSEMVQDPTLTSISLISNHNENNNDLQQASTPTSSENSVHDKNNNIEITASSSSSSNACDSVLNACQDNWVAALSFFEQALSWEPRILLAVSNYETVVRTCLAAARWREAVAVLRLQRRNGVELALPQLRSGMWASALIETAASATEEATENVKQKEKERKTETVVKAETETSSSSIHHHPQHHNNHSLSSVPAWVACLRFYSLIPTYRRTTSDVHVLSSLASSSRIDAAAALSLKKAIFAIDAATATSGGQNNNSNNSNRHHHQQGKMGNNNNNNSNRNKNNHSFRGAKR